MAGKQDDYGYFGKGIDGYVHYKQAFDRNFPSGEQKSNTTSISSTDVSISQPKIQTSQNTIQSPKVTNQSRRTQYNPPSKGEQDGIRSDIGKDFVGCFTWLVMISAIIGIPVLALSFITSSMSAVESGVGILILLAGVLFIICLLYTSDAADE